MKLYDIVSPDFLDESGGVVIGRQERREWGEPSSTRALVKCMTEAIGFSAA